MRLQKVAPRSKLRDKTCLLCRRVLRDGEAAVVVGDPSSVYGLYAYHRDCVEELLASSPYEGTPSLQARTEKEFEELRQRLAERYTSE